MHGHERLLPGRPSARAQVLVTRQCRAQLIARERNVPLRGDEPAGDHVPRGRAGGRLRFAGGIVPQRFPWIRSASTSRRRPPASAFALGAQRICFRYFFLNIQTLH